MHKTTKVALIAVIVIVLASLAFWRTHQKVVQKSDDVVRIGAIIPLTGEVATYGDSLKKAFDLAVNEFNGKVSVIYEDSKGSPKDGVSAMEKLMSQGVKHFLGDATSGVNLAIAPLAERNKSLFMISIATSDDLTKAGEYIFRNCPPNHKQSEAAVRFAKEKLKVTKVAVLAKKDPYAVNLAAKFRELAAQHGLQIVLDEQYEPALRDFTTLIQKLAKAAPELVFVPGNYEETAFILRKARELNLSVPFIGTDGAYSPKLTELAGPAAEGFYITMMGLNEKSNFYKNFAAAYKAKYQSEPDIFAAYGYEGAHILMKAAITGGSLEAQRGALAKESWEGLLGNLKFDENGEVVRDFQILRVKDGRFVSYE